MSTDNYNIDDILSEVKRRRENSEKPPVPEAEEKPQEEEAPQEEAEPQAEEISKADDEPEAEEAPEAEGDTVAEEYNDIIEIRDTPEETVVEDEGKDEMVNIFDFTEEPIVSVADEAVVTAAAAAGKSSRKRKTAKIIIIVLVVLIAIAGVVGAILINKTLNGIVEDNKEKTVAEQEWSGMDKLVESFDPIDETDASELASLQDMIKTWYYNGKPCSSTHVLNVLLIGEDTRGDDILDNGTRADSAIIVSVNIDTNKITLTSILRDTYAYWENEPGDESTGQFGKINGAMSYGNVKTYINCVEHLYKIDINDYVIVNFSSFEDIVDALGGVTLELTSREIDEINRHPKRYGNVVIDKTFEGTSGKLKLTGKQALAYCRIRKLDSDNMRADRQKTCLIEIFNETKDASTGKLLKVVRKLLPYVKTGFSKSEVIQIAKYAFSQGWLGFDTEMHTVPDARINERGAGGIFYGAWCWKSDFPQDAYNLQMRVYGKSNITLARTRVDIIKCAEKGFYKEGAGAVWATIPNAHYGEITTLPSKEKEENNN